MLGGALGGPIIHDKLFFFSQLPLAAAQPARDAAADGADRARSAWATSARRFIRDENGIPVPAQIFDPFNVVQQGPDLFRRGRVPNATIPNPNPSALRHVQLLPEPNRTPDDVYNTNNFEATDATTVRRHSSNNRVDYRHAQHSIYGSGGILYATIRHPAPVRHRRRSTTPLASEDKNPYAQIGDAIVVSPTTVVDVRFGVAASTPRTCTGNKDGSDDYRRFGIPANCRRSWRCQGSAPVVDPERLHRRQRRRQQLVGAVGGTSVPSTSSRRITA